MLTTNNFSAIKIVRNYLSSDTNVSMLRIKAKAFSLLKFCKRNNQLERFAPLSQKQKNVYETSNEKQLIFKRKISMQCARFPDTNNSSVFLTNQQTNKDLMFISKIYKKNKIIFNMKHVDCFYHSKDEGFIGRHHEIFY